jgi:hypothetical protein
MEQIRIEDVLERERKRSKLMRFYLTTKYKIKEMLDIRYQLRKIKWFIQRGRRGYSDSDVWNLFSYLLEVLVPALEDLQRIKHGCPTVNENEDVEDAFKRWTEELQVMIDGFKAAQDAEELYIETTLDDYSKKYDELMVKFDKGMEMFQKRFFHFVGLEVNKYGL